MATNQLLALLWNVLDDRNISEIGKSIGANDGQTKKAIAAALPELLWALSKNASSSDGADALDAALSKDHDGSILESVATSVRNGDGLNGGKILEHILWEAKWQVAGKIAQKSGIWEKQSADMLKVLAPILMWALGKAKKDGNLDVKWMIDLVTKSSGASSLFVQFLDQDGDGDFDKGDMLTMIVNFIKKKFLGGK